MLVKNKSIDSKILGRFYWRYWMEFFRCSGYFVIINVIFESLSKGIFDYLQEIDFFIIIFAAILQSYWQTKWKSEHKNHLFIGNLEY